MFVVNDTNVDVTRFPDGTSQVWKLKLKAPTGPCTIKWKFESESEVFHLMQLCMLLRSMGATDLVLDCPYLPYGRQDKPVSNESAFALSTFASVLRSCQFSAVHTFDAHSDVLGLLLPGIFHSQCPKQTIQSATEEFAAQSICYPDVGAYKRYSQFGLNIPAIIAHKVRNQLTGEITSTNLIERPDALGRVLVIDDICDGGRTFIELAKVLLEAGATSLGLYVSHGIFSKGVQVLKDAGYDFIRTKEGVT